MNASVSASAILGGLLMLGSAQSANVCVGSVAQLQSALALGSLQQSAYTIRVVQGTYLLNSELSFEFSAPTSIEGGYSADCSTRVVDAGNTVIEPGAGNDIYWRQRFAEPEAQITVDGVTLRNARRVHLEAGAFDADPLSGHEPGSVNLRRTRITQIVSPAGVTPIWLEAFSTVRLENVLIDRIDAAEVCAVLLESQEEAAVRVNHMTADLASGDHFCLEDGGDPAMMSIHNSILWNSDGGQSIFRTRPGIFLDSGSSVAFVNDLFHDQAMGAGASVVNAIHADPVWIGAVNGNYQLASNQTASPAINSGTVIVPGGEPATDITGDARIVGSAPDRGAYESAFNNFTLLTVTNTLDAGPGSLRQALLDANSSPAIAKSIQFDIRGAGNVPICPAVISLNSLLPEIASTVSINGYTQATSIQNTDADAFNAELCVLLKPAAATLASAFRVPAAAGANASLTLRGLGLGGFSQAVLILGGSDHVVAGNQFGGVAHGIALPGASLSAITFGANAEGDLIIGGQNAADRNVIGGAAFNGINVQSGVQSSIDHCQVLNNLIGLTPNGQTALASNVGVNISGSGCAITRNRIAGNTVANLWLNGGSDNVVQRNLIGITTQDIGVLNNATGILVTGSGNRIGAGGSGGAISANTVRYMTAGGVVIRGDAVTANSVNANLIYENGASGNGMDIDLQPGSGTAGPDPNDGGDGDIGPNLRQNFPVPTQLVYTGPGSGGAQLDRPATLTATLDAMPGNYRVDAYYSATANPNSQRGHAEVFLGHRTVTVGNGPTSFSMTVVVPNQLPGGVISLTATDANGNSSEIGTALSILAVLVFAHGFE
jgi:hypothetical protein